MKNKITRRHFISNSLKGSILLGTGGSYLLINGCSNTKDFDLIITGGIVYDGLGNPGQELDIAIKNGKIIRIGKDIGKNKAKNVIEAWGLVVSPGFIDAHTHTDTELIANPKAESHIRQGITTEISGNCGSSPFPIADEVLDEWKQRLKDEFNVEPDWNEINGFFQRIERQGTALNYATHVGHGNIRGKVVGFNDIQPSESQIAEMKRIVEENIKAGALGLSTGLEYSPGSYAKTEEIIELCHSVSNLNGIYATHMRDEGDHLLEAIEEVIKITRHTNVNVEIAHFKAAYPANWEKIDEALALVENADKEGIKIMIDRYPYIAASTGLDFFFPMWAKQGTNKDFVAKLKNPDLDEQLRSYSRQQEKKIGSWDKVILSSIFTEKNKKFEGMNIIEASGQTGKDPYEFMHDLLIEEENRVDMIEFIMNEDNLKRILAHPLSIIGSDGSAVAPYGVLHKGKPHPRFYGTFPRILGKYVREENVLTLPGAIQKMTSLAAQKFGLKSRGQIKENYFADLVIFDPETIIDRATWEDPHQYPVGIEYVIVNGEIVVKEGEHTGLLTGKILRNGIG
jgi:N-acyl-D-amino-acid deacylase